MEPDVPQAPEPSPRPERTHHGDALVFGLAAVLVAAVAEVAGHALALPRLQWAAGAAVAAVFCSGVARVARGPDSVTAWQVAAFTTGFGWLGWARFANIRTAAPWLWLTGAAVLLATAYPLLRHRHEKRTEAERRRLEERERLAEQNRWPRLLERIGCPGIKVTGRDGTDSGYVLGLRLPNSGKITIKKLRAEVERLEVAADVRPGTLHFEQGDTSSREVLLYVSTRDFLAETIPFEDNGELLTIQNPIPIGRYEDGTICELTLREIAVLIVGLRGSGKSNLLNVLLAQLVRCVDVLLFVIDTKYRLVMPWVRPWLDDEANGQAIDWAATSRSEAELMLRAFVRGIDARARSGASGAEEKIEPEPERPAVFLVIDELASVFGQSTGPKWGEGTTNRTLTGIGTDAIRLGRSEAMDLIAASQRGTVTMLGDGDFKSQFGIQIGLRVASEADARSVIPDDQQAAKTLATLKHEGTGLVQYRDGRMMRVKFFRIDPAQIAAIACHYGPVKPGPEAVLEDALGGEYATRWERFRDSSKATVRTSTARGGGDDTEREFREITSQLGDLSADDEASPPRKRMREFMRRSGDRGVTVGMIVSLLEAEHMAVTERTVRRWLAEDQAAGIVEGTTRGVYRIRGT